MTLPMMIIINIAIVAVLGLIARFTNHNHIERSDSGWRFNYTNRDLLLIAVIGAMSGIVNTGSGIVWSVVNTAGGPLAGAALQGIFTWSCLLTFFLIRKPGAMLAVSLIQTTISAVLGDPVGLATLGWGFTQGIAPEIVMAICGYHNFSWLAFGLAGAAAAQLGTIWDAYLFGWDSSLSVIQQYWIAAPINMVSGFIFSGLLGWWLGNTIAKTRLVRSAQAK